MSPLWSRATAKRLHRLAKSHAVLAQQKPCFRRLKKDGENRDITTGRKDGLGRAAKTEEFLRKEMLYLVGRGFISRRIQRKTNIYICLMG